jgi:tetratricopeptide (TPR) repeat protein
MPKAKLLFGILFYLIFTGCVKQAEFTYYEEAQKFEKAGKSAEAVDRYRKTVELAPPDSKESLDAARKGYRLTKVSLSDWNLQKFFLNHIVIHSKNFDEAMKAQEEVAEINFSKINNYEEAILCFSRLRNQNLKKEADLDYRFKTAKSYYYLKNFDQAMVEIKDTRTAHTVLKPKEDFRFLVLEANTLLAQSKLESAEKLFRKILIEHPDLAASENIAMNLVVSLEETGKLEEALSTLKAFRTSFGNKDFVDLKMRRLEERISQQPGAKGLRK